MNIINAWKLWRLESQLAHAHEQLDEKWQTADLSVPEMSWARWWDIEIRRCEGEINRLAAEEFDRATRKVRELKERFPNVKYDIQLTKNAPPVLMGNLASSKPG